MKPASKKREKDAAATPPESGSLRLRVLGGFEARRSDGTAVAFSAKKPAALLCFLAFHAGAAQSRDALAALLWEDRAQEQARGSLRQALTALRKLLPPGALDAGVDAVTLQPDAIEVDALRLRAALAAGGVEAAADYRGDLLAGFHPGAAPFEDWLRGEREMLRREALAALTALLERQRRDGATDAAQRTAVRLLALDPLREDVHRALMELYARAGQRAAAVRQYGLCRDLLSSELGAKPEAATDALHAAIRDGQIGAAPAATAAREEPGPPAFELRPVTALSAAPAGDARPGRGAIAAVRRAVEHAVQQFGGTVIAAVGESVTAVFGIPRARSRDTELAARAALALCAGAGLPLRIGIACGQVMVVRRADKPASVVAGTALSDAAALQAAAAPGEILAAPPVQRAVAARLRCERSAEGRWRVVAVAEPGGRDDLAFVGRRGELRLLEAALDACVEERRGQGFLVRGDAGIGKTRLVEETARRAEARGLAVHRAALLDVGVGSGEDLEATLMRSLLDLPAHADASDRAAAAADPALDAVLTPRLRACLYDLLDLPPPPALRAVGDALDASARVQGRAAALAALLVRAASAQPQLVVVEDVHWADATTRDRLAALLDTAADAAALVMVTARREGDGPDAPWRAGRLRVPFGVIELAPLRSEDAAALVAQFPEISAAVAGACIERADGNPLFLEQLLRAASAGAGTLPDTVHSLVRARLDGLAPRDRRAAEAAAVVGQRVPLGTLRHLVDEPAYAPEALVDAALLRPEGGEDYRFAHALLRDAVYASVLDDDRLALHRRAARWFADRDPVLHAEQLELAGDAAAAAAYRGAAAYEAAQARLDRAILLAERGQALAADEALREALRCDAADWLLELGRAQPALLAFTAAAFAARDDAARCRAEIGIGACLRVLERHVDALAALDRAEAAAHRAGLTAPLATIAYLRGCLYFPLGRLDECLQANEMALTAARAAGSPLDEARAESGLGDAYYQRGDMPAAQLHFARCLELARAHDLGRVEVANIHMHGVTLMYGGDAAAALRTVEEAVARTRALGSPRAEMVARSCVCDVAVWVGDWRYLADAAAPIEAMARTLGSRSFGVHGAATTGFALVNLGRREEGLAHLDRVRPLCTGSVASFIGPTVLGMIAVATPDAAVRAEALAEAEAQLAAGSVSHNHLAFRPLAMQACWQAGDAAGIAHHRDALARYGIGAELPWTHFFVAWGDALAASARGEGDRAQLAAVRDRAVGGGFGATLPPIDAALRRC